jgi:hypothetical protein
MECNLGEEKQPGRSATRETEERWRVPLGEGIWRGMMFGLNRRTIESTKMSVMSATMNFSGCPRTIASDVEG